MRLIITRHGETKENQEGIIQGHLPGHLSENGRYQAEKVALRLRDEKINFIYSSDLSRAVDTAIIIHKFHKGIPLKFVDNLRERFLGEWQGKNEKELDFDESKNVTAIFPKDGETFLNLFERAKNFIPKIILKHDDSTVLLVGHNGINKALISVITGKSPNDISSLENQHNTAINIFDIDKKNKYSVQVINCVKHLD